MAVIFEEYFSESQTKPVTFFNCTHCDNSGFEPCVHHDVEKNHWTMYRCPCRNQHCPYKPKKDLPSNREGMTYFPHMAFEMMYLDGDFFPFEGHNFIQMHEIARTLNGAQTSGGTAMYNSYEYNKKVEEEGTSVQHHFSAVLARIQRGTGRAEPKKDIKWK